MLIPLYLSSDDPLPASISDSTLTQSSVRLATCISWCLCHRSFYRSPKCLPLCLHQDYTTSAMCHPDKPLSTLHTFTDLYLQVNCSCVTIALESTKHLTHGSWGCSEALALSNFSNLSFLPVTEEFESNTHCTRPTKPLIFDRSSPTELRIKLPLDMVDLLQRTLSKRLQKDKIYKLCRSTNSKGYPPRNPCVMMFVVLPMNIPSAYCLYFLAYTGNGNTNA